MSDVVTSENYPQFATRTERVPTESTVVDPRLVLPIRAAFVAAVNIGSGFDDIKRALFYGQQKDHAAILGKLGDVNIEIPKSGLSMTLTVEQYRMLHAACGLMTEAVEFLETVAKNITDGTPIDRVNVMEELGDIDWYKAIPMNLYAITIVQTLAANIAKLKARYPNKFELDKALNRDLDAERKILEGAMPSEKKE